MIPTLTPEAKQLLSSTVRGLRERLLRDIRDEAERRYHLSVPLAKAGLDEAHRKKRERLDEWIEERVRAAKPKTETEKKAVRERLLQQAVKEAGATLLNRLVLLRHLEAIGLAKPQVVSGGWSSNGYREFRDFAPGLLGDETEGYATLLQMVFDDLAVDLPGLFGDVGLTKLFPAPPATLREVVEQLDAKELASAWTDDTTLGWVYQYWNDPEREALDAKIHDGGKIEPHEIASKTQMFTERYMVEWVLQNSLGLTWLCICKKNGWTPDAERVLPILDARRAEWRKRRDTGEVALDALMPIDSELEDTWKYYVPQPIPDDAVAKAPESIRTLKLLDPACGSGHFLVIAFDLLARMYREEARHRGTTVTDEEIAEAILESNLHGVDIDPRAIQIAAAALYLKAKTLSPKARPQRVNLVAPTLQLGNLPEDDPSVVQLRKELKAEAGISEELTQRLVSALSGVDHLGTLLKVDAAVEEALKSAELEIERGLAGQGDLFNGFAMQQVKLSLGEAKATVLDKLEQFLARHSGSEDLGLRLDGEQLAAGVRFVRLVKEATYDVVVGNPPYSDLGLLADIQSLGAAYPLAKANLYSCFLERGLGLARKDGLVALLTMRGWLYIKEYETLRARAFLEHDIRSVGDFDRGAFEDVPNDLLAVTVVTFRRSGKGSGMPHSVAIQPFPFNDRSYDRERTARKRAATLVQAGRHEFLIDSLRVVEGWPLVFWWSPEFLERYAHSPKLGGLAPIRQGMATSDNPRFIRLPHEVLLPRLMRQRFGNAERARRAPWVPYIKGADGQVWVEPLRCSVRWEHEGLELKVFHTTRHKSYSKRIASESFYFQRGISFSTIGADFSARAHRYSGIFGHAGSSVFPTDVSEAVCLMNSRVARYTLESINPTISFQNGDVERLGIVPIGTASQIFDRIEASFGLHEQTRETSVEFKRPGPSQWRSTQEWAQLAVDRPEGAPLPPYSPADDPPLPENFVSFAVGVALGRFYEHGEGLLEAAPETALSAGILFISIEGKDSLDSTPGGPICDAWKEHGAAVGGGDDLRSYLRKSFFDYHRKLYENRPIYFPISSAKKSYVAFVSVHRWKDDTLNVLLADHLVPEKRRLEGEVEDIRKARAQASGKGKAEKRFAEVQKLLEELGDLIDKVTQIAECGPPPSDEKTPKREVDARFVMDLDDGVMINSAALWALLEPQWKDPKKWWKELATAQGRKDYDWAHLAARYFPKRVRAKCEEDPSLAVAHHCFWALHPAKAYAWELRLQDETKPEFTIDEPGSDDARARFLKEHATEAAEIRANETKRRERKAAKTEAEDDDDAGPLFDRDEPQAEAADA